MAEIKKITDLFVKTLREVIRNCKKEMRTEEELAAYDQVERGFRLCPDEEKFLLSESKIWLMRDIINARDFDMLAKFNLASLYDANTEDTTKELVANLFEIVKEKYPTLSQAKQTEYWNLMHVLLACVTQYKKIKRQIS